MRKATIPLCLDGFGLQENGLIYGNDALRRTMSTKERMRLVTAITENLNRITDAAQAYRDNAMFKDASSLYDRCYRYKGRIGVYGKGVPEKEIARGLFLIKDSTKFHLQANGETNIGEVVDYETPLFHTQSSDKQRRIDLISTKRGISDELFIVELKAPNARDHLARCLMEAYTYSIFSNRKKLRQDYGVRQDARIVLCPMIFVGSVAGDDYDMLLNGNCPELMDLVKKIEMDNELAVRFAVLNRNDKPAFVSDPKGRQFMDSWWN